MNPLATIRQELGSMLVAAAQPIDPRLARGWTSALRWLEADLNQAEKEIAQLRAALAYLRKIAAGVVQPEEKQWGATDGRGSDD